MAVHINISILKGYGVGRRKLDDNLFLKDKPPPKYGIYDLEDEKFCHDIVKSTCHIPGCKYTAESLLEFENHYNGSHRYSCSQCKKVLPSPHFLDLHIQEMHDSFFAVLATKKPSYCCYIEECKEKFLNSEERFNHCVNIHKLPKDFRFDQKPKGTRKSKQKNARATHNPNNNMPMELDNKPSNSKIVFNNSKQKAFSKYAGKKFTTDTKAESTNLGIKMDELMESLDDDLQ